MHQPPTPGTLRPLTPRQQQIVALIVAHKSYEQIATALGCSVHTVAAHVRHIALVLPEGFCDLPPRMAIYAWAIAVENDERVRRAIEEARALAS